MNNIENYQNLANAIIKKACSDYKYNRITAWDFECFIYSPWFTFLTDANPNYIYNAVIEEKVEYEQKKKERTNKHKR